MRFAVVEGQAGQRLDALVGAACGLSRSQVKALFEAEAVRVDGRLARKGQSALAGQQVEVALPEVTSLEAVPDEAVRLAVLWQDEALCFVDKPAGLPSVPQAPGEKGTVANGLAALFPGITEASESPAEAGLCHRLDGETSGVMVAAKSRADWLKVREQFGRAGTVDKRYLALVRGPVADEGVIDVPLAHHGNTVRPAVGDEDARPAVSRVKVLARAGSASLVEVVLLTGVLHQARAHLAAVGAPIAGDRLYGGPPVEGLPRFFLHAASLSLLHPRDGRRVTVESPLPEDLRAVAVRLGLPG